MNLGSNAAHAMREKGGDPGSRALGGEVWYAGTTAPPVPGAQAGSLHPRLTVRRYAARASRRRSCARIFEPFFTTEASRARGPAWGWPSSTASSRATAGRSTVAERARQGIRVHGLPAPAPGRGRPKRGRAPGAVAQRDGTDPVRGRRGHPGPGDDQAPRTPGIPGPGLYGRARRPSRRSGRARTPSTLVIMDQTMPRHHRAKSWPAALLRDQARTCPIILCTGYSETLDEGRALANRDPALSS